MSDASYCPECEGSCSACEGRLSDLLMKKAIKNPFSAEFVEKVMNEAHRWCNSVDIGGTQLKFSHPEQIFVAGALFVMDEVRKEMNHTDQASGSE